MEAEGFLYTVLAMASYYFSSIPFIRSCILFCSTPKGQGLQKGMTARRQMRGSSGPP